MGATTWPCYIQIWVILWYAIRGLHYTCLIWSKGKHYIQCILIQYMWTKTLPYQVCMYSADKSMTRNCFRMDKWASKNYNAINVLEYQQNIGYQGHKMLVRRPWSDCFFRSSLIWVWTIWLCFYGRQQVLKFWNIAVQ